ncbi:DUF2855 family protein [Halioxenophilus sp. WMMB6]|uniref:DUF2855 family protein n=1 Tax=Halioxenophilus sp. WMMB6 TaxID=3073815 RepID=UPI00295F0FDE|nr:DUF2855 family protein [Halioxenophilus sp. WMMB6]
MLAKASGVRDSTGLPHMHNVSLEFNQQDVRRLAVVNESIPVADQLDKGSMLVRIERFGFSCNNLSSALAPGLNCSWPQLFVGRDGRRCLPVWGYAEVVESNRDGLAPGMGFYGCFPMSRFLMIDTRQSANGRFSFGFDQALPNNGASLPTFTAVESFADIDMQILLRPLLSAAYLILQELIESQFWQAGQIIITSASSKTAMGLSYFLQEYFHRIGMESSPLVVGLTAARHQAFVSQNGHFDQVFSYEQFRQMEPAESVLVDFSGNHQVQSMIHYYLKQRLIYAYNLGSCHWDQQAPTRAERPEAESFSAVEFYRQHSANQDHLNHQFQESWKSACEAFGHWLQPRLVEGVEEVRWVYEQMLAGKATPEVGYLCQL